MENIKIEKIESIKCPKCKSEYVFFQDNKIKCDSCEKISANTSDCIKVQQAEFRQTILDEIGDTKNADEII